MAAFDNSSPQQFKNARIECPNHRCVANFVNFVERALSDAIDENLYQYGAAEPLKELIIKKYKSTFVSNLQVNGNPVNLDDTSALTTQECCNSNKDEVLTTKVDKQMINTAQLRKTAPLKIHSGIKKQIRHELLYLTKVKVEPEVRPEDGNIAANHPRLWDNVPGETDIQTDTDDGIIDLKQECENMLSQCKRLHKAVQHYERSEESDVQRALYGTPVIKQQSVTQWIHKHTHSLHNLRI